MAGNYVLLETIALTQTAESVTFDNIPQTGYTDLVAKISVRQGGGSGSRIQFNSDTSTANYQQRRMYGDGTTAVSDSATSLGYFAAIGFNNNTATANVYGSMEFCVPNYTGSDFKSISIDAVTEDNNASAFGALTAGTWLQTSAITSVTLTPNTAPFQAGCTFSLYGVAAFGTEPKIAPKATGGNIVANDGTYWYHAFLTSGTFTPQLALSCSIMSVGAGGGGGCFGGGGGAGELDLFSSQFLEALVYPVTVGAGGAGSTNYDVSGTNGNATSFASLVSSLGGGGGGRDGVAGIAGGSGGGGGKASTGGSASGSNTNVGGNGGGADANVMASGGGGGATAAGTAGTSSANTSATGGNGGQGYALSSIGGLTSAIPGAFGSMTHISSGGGGSAFKTDSTGGSAPVGGTGGTGAGNGGYARQTNSPLVAPTASTSYGSGGGGSASSAGTTTLGAGTNGYQGIVIIRYAMT